MKRRYSALVLALVLLCTGCSLDVDSYLRPPQVGGQQQAVQAALETYLRDSGGDVRYTLEYPVEGDHTAAFVFAAKLNWHAMLRPLGQNAPFWRQLNVNPFRQSDLNFLS